MRSFPTLPFLLLLTIAIAVFALRDGAQLRGGLAADALQILLSQSAGAQAQPHAR